MVTIQETLPKAIITRPALDQEKLAEDLQLIGYQPISMPVIIPQYYQMNLTDLEGKNIIVTSKHALLALQQLSKVELSAYNILGLMGEEYQQFTNIIKAANNVADLLTYINKNFSPTSQDQEFLYLRGEDISLDIAASLQQQGYKVKECIIYNMQARHSLTFAERNILAQLTPENNQHHIIIFLSKRSAEIFLQLIDTYNLKLQCSYLTAYVFSDNIKKTLQKIFWRDIVITQPNMQDLIAKIKEAGK